MDLLQQAKSLVTDPRHTRWLVPLQLLGDAVLCGLIVWTIPYTEIDWKAYMQQIEQYTAGERNYAKIYGDTGPLVYPAAHVYIYRILYSLTSNGTDIATAQVIFGALYILTIFFVMQTYRQAGVPPYLLPLLSLSKRAHSIFLLRLFNDCFAVGFLFAAVWCWQRRWWTVGTLVYAVGVGVKMSLLLVLPAVGVVLWLGMGRARALRQAQSIVQVQILIAYPFILGGLKSYLSRAFELSRTFMFKWTVNWRFVGEERFLGRPFSLLLIVVHLTLLYTFGAGRWLAPSGWSVPDAIDKLFDPPPKEEEERISRRITPNFILTALLSSMIIGCLCARSLHYQFFVYLVWSTPFLLWKSGMKPVLIYAICVIQEWAWNVYPSTPQSSLVVVGCLAITVGSVWIGTSPHLTPEKAKPAQNGHVQHRHVE